METKILRTCSKDFNPASFPQLSISLKIKLLISELAQSILKVPGILFSWAQHFKTSTSGTTIATIHDFNDSPYTKTWWTYWLFVYAFSIFSGTIYSPWDNLKICLFRSIIFSVPFWKTKIIHDKWSIGNWEFPLLFSFSDKIYYINWFHYNWIMQLPYSNDPFESIRPMFKMFKALRIKNC